MIEEEYEYHGVYKHKKGCDCPIVNPVTEWVGGSFVTITGYECPKCHVKTPKSDVCNGINIANNF